MRTTPAVCELEGADHDRSDHVKNTASLWHTWLFLWEYSRFA